MTVPGYFKDGEDPSSARLQILMPPSKVTVAPEFWPSIIVMLKRLCAKAHVSFRPFRVIRKDIKKSLIENFNNNFRAGSGGRTRHTQLVQGKLDDKGLPSLSNARLYTSCITVSARKKGFSN